MRLDVREATIKAAEAERFHNRCYIVLVSEVIVEELRDKWSPPVQVTISTEGGIAEMSLRNVSNQESKP